ncbi:glycosyltransferase family 4 protein [Shewanella sp. A3A]|nr:glycosyltransferase family 4 protein [Shewanella ferrihydritica]
MKIVQFVREIGFGGGVSVVAKELENEFKKNGLEVGRFTLSDVVPSKKDEVTLEQKSLVIKKLKLFRDVFQFSFLGALKAKRRYKRQIDTISIVHNDIMFGDIYINHGLHIDMLTSSKSPLWMLIRNPIHPFLIFREWLRHKLKIHSAIICFCKNDAERFSKFYPSVRDRIHIIPNGINLDIYKSDLTIRQEYRNSLGYKEDDFCLIFIGHEFERKGLRFIIDALCELELRVKLIVVGGGSTDAVDKYKAYCKKKGVADRVNFLGVRTDVPYIINASDLFVLPSSYETWALVGLESMATKKPVLMHPTGGISDYLVDGKNGFNIDLNKESIVEKVNELLTNPSLYNDMCNEALATSKIYSWDRIAAMYLDLFVSIRNKKIINE